MPEIRIVPVAVLVGRARDALTLAVTESAANIVVTAKALAPELSGTLRAEISVTEIRHLADGAEAKIESLAPYSVEQHEKAWYHHTSGGPKFVEHALLAEEGLFLAAVGRFAAKVF